MNQLTLTSANEAEKIAPPCCYDSDVSSIGNENLENLWNLIQAQLNHVLAQRDQYASRTDDLQQKILNLELQNDLLRNSIQPCSANCGSLIWMVIKIDMFQYIGRFFIHGKLSTNNNNLYVAEEMIDDQGIYTKSLRFRNCELKDCYEFIEQVPNHNTIPILHKENGLNEHGLFTRGSEIIIEKGRRCWFQRRGQLMEGNVIDSKLTNGKLKVSYDTGSKTRREIALELSDIYMHPSLLISPLFLHRMRNSRKK
jgi:hypothetical protein